MVGWLGLTLIVGGAWAWLGTSSRLGFPAFLAGVVLLLVWHDRRRPRGEQDPGGSSLDEVLDDVLESD